MNVNYRNSQDRVSLISLYAADSKINVVCNLNFAWVIANHLCSCDDIWMSTLVLAAFPVLFHVPFQPV
jgi:hypothetical protein